ncbi:hypothetical protein [Corallococcus sp. 4LFB]|uniref:hypothetical protein n=1 Tax=Corallococcus sp. 4LFB TaxID=3383249 RepID=UPI003975D541
MRGTLAALACAVSLTASPASAQDDVPTEPRPERLYFNSGALLGSARMVGLGGAYVGIAEGAAGVSSNLSALAQRSPSLERDWDLGVTLSWLDLPFTGTKRRDVDNDGLADESVDNRQLLGALMLQYKRFGIGFLWRNSRTGYCITLGCRGEGEKLRVSLTQSVLAGSVAFGQDDFILSLGIFSAQASFSELGDESWRYGDTGVAVDMLYRPHGRPYRIGVAVRPEVVAGWRRDDDQSPSSRGGRSTRPWCPPRCCRWAPAGGWARARTATTGCPPPPAGSSRWTGTRCRCRRRSPATRSPGGGSSPRRWTSSPA